MRKALPITLWTLAILCLGVAGYYALNPGDVSDDTEPPIEPAGAVLIDVPWERLPHVPPFELTNQMDRPFQYPADITGRPMAISFFFASCPSICRDLNRQISRLREQLANEEISFVSITVDAINDTPDVLERYARDFEATPPDWIFLTGKPYRIDELGEQVFRVVVDKDTHTDNILLIDRWGKYRDRFKWDDPYDMKRFVKIARELIAETEPPYGEVIRTRNALAGHEPANWDTVPWIREFFLRREDGSKMSSRDLTGQVWIGSFFFVSCPGICVEQNQYLAGLQTRLAGHQAKIVSITTDPVNDTPTILNQYARKIGADSDRWWFGTTGDANLLQRISSEFFGAAAGADHHSSELFVVDRWGNVRGRFDWQQAAQEVRMLELIGELNSEKTPPLEVKVITGESVIPRENDPQNP